MLDPETVARAYATSAVMRQFGRGDPGVVVGQSGRELGRAVYRAVFGPDTTCPPATRSNGATPEYWSGWALAHLQWQCCKTFRWIFERTTLANLLSKYRVYHEMDITHFLDDFAAELAQVKTETHLKRIRQGAGFSQAQLAKVSGVNVRNIQLYEQRVQPIERASAETLLALSRPLGCSLEDLLDF